MKDSRQKRGFSLRKDVSLSLVELFLQEQLIRNFCENVSLWFEELLGRQNELNEIEITFAFMFCIIY